MFSFLSLPPFSLPHAALRPQSSLILYKAFLMILCVLSLPVMRPAFAQEPAGQWVASPCDATGNPLSYISQDQNGFYMMGGSYDWSYTNSYPAVLIPAARDHPYGYGVYVAAGMPNALVNTDLFPIHCLTFDGLGDVSENFPNEARAANGLGSIIDALWWYDIYNPDTHTSDIGLLNGSVTAKVTGHLAYYFKIHWESDFSDPTPPLPDHINLLLRTDLEAEASVFPGLLAQNNGLSAVSTATDGLPFGETASASAGLDSNGLLVGAAGPAKVEGYHLVRSAVDPATHIAAVFLDGELNWEADNPVLFGNLDTDDPWRSTVTNGLTAATATGYITAGVKRTEVHLISPDPSIHPEAGNDHKRQKNQFIYGDVPAGSAHDEAGAYSDPHDLFVPITVAMNGASADEMLWLKDHMEISVTPAIPNALAFDKVINGNQITLESRYTVFNAAYPGFGDLVTYNGFLAHDLPTHNSDFGNHQVTLKVDGQIIDVANIQTYFKPFDSTHPFDLTGPTRGVYMPNFYYYYDQVYPSPGEYIAWSPTGTSYTDHIYPFQIHFADDAYSGYSLPVFDTGPILAEPGPIRWVGSVTVPNGILAWVHTCAHEKGHQDLLQDGGVYDFSVGGIDAYSHDGDNVYDPWETTHGLDNTKSDSTGAYGGANEPGDNELLADVAALPAVYGNVDLWNQDWASTGIQYGFLLPSDSSPADALFDFQAQVAGESLKPDGQKSTKSIPDLLSEFPGSIVHGGLP